MQTKLQYSSRACWKGQFWQLLAHMAWQQDACVSATAAAAAAYGEASMCSMLLRDPIVCVLGCSQAGDVAVLLLLPVVQL